MSLQILSALWRPLLNDDVSLVDIELLTRPHRILMPAVVVQQFSILGHVLREGTDRV